MLLTRTASLTFAVACLTAIAAIPTHSQTAGAYGSAPGYSGAPAAYSSTPGYDRPQSDASQAQSASARRNVAESHQYDRALGTNRGFRQARIRKECGPISDPELRQSCLASFQQDERSKSSSSSSRAQDGAYGR